MRREFTHMKLRKKWPPHPHTHAESLGRLTFPHPQSSFLYSHLPIAALSFGLLKISEKLAVYFKYPLANLQVVKVFSKTLSKMSEALNRMTVSHICLGLSRRATVSSWPFFLFSRPSCGSPGTVPQFPSLCYR